MSLYTFASTVSGACGVTLKDSESLSVKQKDMLQILRLFLEVGPYLDNSCIRSKSWVLLRIMSYIPLW